MSIWYKLYNYLYDIKTRPTLKRNLNQRSQFSTKEKKKKKKVQRGEHLKQIRIPATSKNRCPGRPSKPASSYIRTPFLVHQPSQQQSSCPGQHSNRYSCLLSAIQSSWRNFRFGYWYRRRRSPCWPLIGWWRRWHRRRNYWRDIWTRCRDRWGSGIGVQVWEEKQ
jgi:hypothetical protein